MNGKGDKPRPIDGKKYRENYDRIFAKKWQCNQCGHRFTEAESESVEMERKRNRLREALEEVLDAASMGSVIAMAADEIRDAARRGIQKP